MLVLPSCRNISLTNMYSRSIWNFEAPMLVFYTLTIVCNRISGSSSPLTQYNIFAGRTFSSDVEFTMVAGSKVDCIVSLRALTKDVAFTVAVYNESSKACTQPAIGDQSVIIQESGNPNIMALWSTSVCSAFTSPESAFYEYIDTDLNGFDMTDQEVSSEIECIHLCITNYGNAFKGFEYHYAKPGSSKTCFCKSVSREEYQDLGYSLSSLSGFSYYDRLCFY